ncbi:hypothetical protein [Desertibaculum subflavum]|uniref:hypothetical protein n=1 Tax=Desertibaculum subflavum TaxID=2268458 RepID=UPI000E660311
MVALLTVLAGCTGHRTATLKATSPDLPAPAFQPLPKTVAVWYPPDLANHRSTGEWMVRRGDNDYLRVNYDVDAGDAHLRTLRLVINSAFRRVVELPTRPVAPVAIPDIDLVVVPDLHRIGYGHGAEVEYALDIRAPDGASIQRISATGASPSHATEEDWFPQALRDAAAGLLVRLAKFGSEPASPLHAAPSRVGDAAFAVLPERLEVDGRIAECVAESLSDALHGMPMVKTSVLRDRLYPWLEPSTKPYFSSDLAALLDHPVIRERTAQLGIRYIVHAGGGRLGGAYRDVTTCFGALCLDLPTSKDLGSQISARAFDLEAATGGAEHPSRVSTMEMASAQSRGSSFAIGWASCSEVAQGIAGAIDTNRRR